MSNEFGPFRRHSDRLREQTGKALRVFQASRLVDEALVIIDGSLREDQLIGETMPDKNLAAVATELMQIGNIGTDHTIEERSDFWNPTSKLA